MAAPPSAGAAVLDERSRWIAACARAVERLLAIEHSGAPGGRPSVWRRPAAGADLRRWAQEIRTLRAEMAAALRESPALQVRCAESFAEAWEHGLLRAAERLAGGRLRQALRHLAVRCPYALEQGVAYDPWADREPREDMFPPGVARALNKRAGGDYPILSAARAVRLIRGGQRPWRWPAR